MCYLNYAAMFSAKVDVLSRIGPKKTTKKKKKIDEMQTLTKTFNHSVKHRKKDGEEKTGKKSLETETERAKSNADPLENGERLDAFV